MNNPEQVKSLISQMLQACKNIMSVTSDYSIADEIKDQDFVLDNVYMNIVVIIETYMKTDKDIKDSIISQEEIKYFTDIINNDFREKDLSKILYVSKHFIPTLITKLNEILTKL
ncbi:MAG: hypothetical protein IKQ46_09780 [Bacteroidales bacterium]|nr:hypothetical protein [Bacteroidales bacterium]